MHLSIARKTAKKITLMALAAMLALPAMGQDKLANAAPVDRRLKAIDSLSIRRLKAREDVTFGFENPAEDLYGNSWANNYMHYGRELPSEFKIDIRQFHMPCDSRKVTSHYGYRASFGRNHYGTDIKVYTGDTIRAAFNGKVRVVAYEGKGYGNYVVIRHPNGLETYYGHMSKHLVRNNQVVRAGQAIGLGGSTGRSTGSHLHFETRLLGRCINPELMFDFGQADIKGDYYVYRPNGHSTLLGNVSKAATGHVAADNRREVASTSESSRVHPVVNSRETLASISLKVGVTVDRLCELNNLKKTDRLRRGQLIRY